MVVPAFRTLAVRPNRPPALLPSEGNTGVGGREWPVRLSFVHGASIRDRKTSSRGGSASSGQDPPRTRKVAGVAVRVALEIVLVLGLGLPEGTRRDDLRHHLAGPQPRSLDVGDGVFRYPTLLIVEVEDGRAVARAYVITLTVDGGGVMDLKEEFEQVTIGRLV